MKLTVSTRQAGNGFDVLVNRKPYPVRYPEEVWQTFPQEFRNPFSQTIACITTIHTSFALNTYVDYEFPLPPVESLFFNGLVLSMPENITDFEDKNYDVSFYLQRVINSFYKVRFKHNEPSDTVDTPFYKSRTNTAIIPFTFGKDSLLTLALCRELGIRPTLVFFIEPTNRFENRQKRLLMKRFSQEFGYRIYEIEVPLAQLKQTHGLWWGWDIFLTQYTLFLIPYLHFFKPEYLLWSNEMECNETINFKGWRISQTFDQSGLWLRRLYEGLQSFAVPTHVASIIEPLSRLAIITLLHGNYPDLAKYQTSCLLDAKSAFKKRWCGECYECANTFLYFKALGINPEKVGLMDDMFATTKLKYQELFSRDYDKRLNFAFSIRRDEKIFALSLASHKGILSREIEKKMRPILRKFNHKKDFFLQYYFSLHDSYSISEALYKPVITLLEKKLRRIRKTLRKDLRVPAGKSATP